jgi:hypothetical protein
MGVRQYSILAVLAILSILLVLSGCGGVTGNCVKEIVVDERPIINTIELYADEPYTVQETRVVGEKCIEKHYSEMNDSQFTITHGDKEWVEEPATWGETNHLRRIAKIYNGRDEIDAVYVDKVYFFKGEETKRSRHAMMFLIEPKTTRELYVMWDTQYHPDKDIKLEFTNHTDELGFETTVMKMCYNETEKVNVTEYRKVKTGETEQVEGYETVKRVVLDCK